MKGLNNVIGLVWSHLALFDPSCALETLPSPNPSFSFHIMAMANQPLPFWASGNLADLHRSHIQR